jgi:hypothetical protein
MKEKMSAQEEKYIQLERELLLSKKINQEQQSELSELHAHAVKVEEERNSKGQDLKDLHVKYINETSKLESTLSILRSEIETMATESSTKIERLERSLLSSEHERKEATGNHKHELAQSKARLNTVSNEEIKAVTLELTNQMNALTRNTQIKMEHLGFEHKNKIDVLHTKLEVEIASHRESSKNADIALSRLRETLDLERDIQVTAIKDEKQQMERLYKQKLHSEIEKHQDVHSTLRLHLNELNETTTELQAKLRLAERERGSQLRSKDEELLRALENSRLEHQEAHKATVAHYENTIKDMQTSLVLTRGKLNEVELKHARNVENVVADRNKVAHEVENDQKSSLKMLSLGLEKEATRATQARMSEQRVRGELNEKNRELENISYTHQAAQRDLSDQFQQQMQVCVCARRIHCHHGHSLSNIDMSFSFFVSFFLFFFTCIIPFMGMKTQ